jgi:hypothetical protein
VLLLAGSDAAEQEDVAPSDGQYGDGQYEEYHAQHPEAYEGEHAEPDGVEHAEL